jgi:hypothetical protein
MKNSKIEKVMIDFKQVKEPKTGVKNGREWKMTPISIKVGEVWYNGSCFKDEQVEEFNNLNTDKQVYIKTWVEEYNGNQYNKFALLNEQEKMQLKLDELLLFYKFMLNDSDLREKYIRFKAEQN